MTKAHRITTVKEGSIAEESGVSTGDMLLSINGDPIEDILEYRYVINDYYIEVLIKKVSGEEWLLEIDKEPYEDLGLVFETELMSPEKSCANKCIFCFIDQLPQGMRESLYFKDDDLRLSFLQGNFISLTNLRSSDIDRIIKYRISPLNVSVHTTDPDLRVRMLRNPRADKGLRILDTFSQNGLALNCQIVLCPGINDGIELDRTLRDLFNLGHNIKSIGVVPVGITRYREGLFPLRPLDARGAVYAIDIINKWQRSFYQRCKSRVVYAADELYLKAKLPIPHYETYGDFPQLENGIGMMSLFEKQFNDMFNGASYGYRKRDRISIATGVAAADFIKRLIEKAEKKTGHRNISVYPISNKFFGETINVSGLVTGNDLIAQLRDKELGKKLIIPKNMLRAGEEVFLDDITISMVKEALDVEVRACPVDGGILLEKLILGGL